MASFMATGEAAQITSRPPDVPIVTVVPDSPIVTVVPDSPERTTVTEEQTPKKKAGCGGDCDRFGNARQNAGGRPMKRFGPARGSVGQSHTAKAPRHEIPGVQQQDMIDRLYKLLIEITGKDVKSLDKYWKQLKQ